MVDIDYSLHFDDEKQTDVTHLLCLHKKRWVSIWVRWPYRDLSSIALISAREVGSSHQCSLRFNVTQVSAINGHAVGLCFALYPFHARIYPPVCCSAAFVLQRFVLRVFPKHPSQWTSVEGDMSNAFLVKSKRPSADHNSPMAGETCGRQGAMWLAEAG